MKDIALFLYNLTDNMAQPWIDAGYRVVMIDMQHPQGIHEHGQITKIGADIRNGWMPPREIIDRIAFVAAFPPCDHLAVSGSRWFKGKGLRKLALSVDLFATAAELCEWLGAPYLIENPVSTMSTYWRKPDYVFHPHHFTLLEPNDNYTKTTCLWTRGASSCRLAARITPWGCRTTESINVRPDLIATIFAVQRRLDLPVPCSWRTESNFYRWRHESGSRYS